MNNKQNPFSLNGKNIIITGASSGIGKQCAITCSEQGANIALIARNEERLENTYDQLQPGNHISFAQDITEFDMLESLIKEIVEKIGKISGFVHCAGVELTLPLRNMKPELYKKIFDVNVVSGFELAKYITKRKNIADKASLVFISSVMGVISQPGLIGYSASKGALISGVKTLALELSKKQTRTNCISPGYVNTPLLNSLSEERKNILESMHPLGLGEPTDIANAVVFLLSDGSK
ncbi:MAG: SDR family oxidoreductase, partial [Caldisericia bacterium]|nr:SDR family oxidoreductase [Caldisericia bacterium]